MILLKQIKDFFSRGCVDMWVGIENFHICTGEWEEKFEQRSGGGTFGFKKCNYDVSWRERTCTVCGVRKVKGVSQSECYNWHE